MTVTFYRISCAGMIAAAMLLGGCKTFEHPKPAAATEPEPTILQQVVAFVTPEPSAPPAALNDGISLYNKGSYNAAIKRLSNAPEIWSAGKSTQTEALKYMAFSYCVTSRKQLCKQQFQKALKLDPAFDLAPGEKGHPLWGPVFTQAKR
ncbi:TssQ family T6SS-associated lipoprotein [Paraherbaspirillum soli]|uniref:TssQ family T6SS-associated lipoprotein n=1 Tax=Paraherbaspirillum soli TaxID=631222 RepID=A0ABW0M6R0_9BURK